MKPFIALDLFNNKVVRLKRGELGQMTEYGDPFKWLNSFIQTGVKYVHLVDLNAAVTNNDQNRELISRILSEFKDLKFQVAGGIKTKEDARRLIDLGAYRVVVGSLGVTNPELTSEIITEFNERIVLAFDVRETEIYIDGWKTRTNTTIEQILSRLNAPAGITILVTQILSDGMLSGLDIDFYANLASRLQAEILVSGGIKDILDIIKVKELKERTNKIDGVILGKSVYEGLIDIKRAIDICKQ
jgi:phosphoribosylformimino-5-aminoimidazole carboxamide ribotide isomerase